MSEKQFDFKDKYITLNGGFLATCGNKNDAELISRTLNQLYEENLELTKENQELQKMREDYTAYQISVRRELLYHYKDLTRQLESRIDCPCSAQSRARIITIMNKLGIDSE